MSFPEPKTIPEKDPPAMSPEGVVRDSSQAVRHLLAERDRWFAERLAFGIDPLELCRLHTDCLDGAIRLLAFKAGEKAVPPPFAVLALGGYGRGEMGLACDLDLLFLRAPGGGEVLRDVIDGVLYPFWDSRVEIGGATRTLDDCRAVIEEDVRALTAMMEARLICGEGALFEELKALLRKHFARGRTRRRFIDLKLAERVRRLEERKKAIAPSALNLKEGEGGLRDYHTLLWIAAAAEGGGDLAAAMDRAVPHPDARRRIEEARRFLWRVRHALHVAGGGRADLLSDALLPRVAKLLGFAEEAGSSPEEFLLAEYDRQAQQMHAHCSRAIVRLRRRVAPPFFLVRWARCRKVGDHLVRTEHGTLTFKHPNLARDPLAILRLFSAAREQGMAVDSEALEGISLGLAEVPPSAFSSEKAGALWRSLLHSPAGLGELLERMLESGLIERFFPEMIPMLHLVPRDGVHLLSAGRHSVRVVAELSAIWNGKRRGGRRRSPESKALGDIERVGVLVLAALLHDVGKGRGGDHAAEGVPLAGAVARRLSFADRDVEDVVFLVRSHLLMTRLAFRRDINDAALIERFTQSVETPERLAMLFLLTLSDLKAIGSGVWNDWKGGLLAELFLRTREVLTGGAGPEEMRQREERALERAISLSGGEGQARALKHFVACLPERYLLSTAPETIAAHFLMVQGIGGEPLAMAGRTVAERGCTELTVVTRDAPGLFATIAGILSAGGANILDAQLFTSTDGMVIDLLWLTDAAGRPLEDAGRWAQIRKEMAEAISGRRKIEEIFGGRFQRRLLTRQGVARSPKVLIDNDVSASDTVVEIAAEDQLGLLYAIASALHAMGCTIERARIATHVDRVTDVFYIRDARGGGKIVEKRRLEEIRGRLIEVLSG